MTVNIMVIVQYDGPPSDPRAYLRCPLSLGSQSSTPNTEDGLCMYWMDGWRSGWMDGWVDGWMGGRIDRWVGGWMDEWMDGRIDRWMMDG